MTTSQSLHSVGSSEKGYTDLKNYFSNINTMFSVRNTLAVDMMTAMPSGAMSQRLQDIASITKRIYAETTSPSVTNLLAEVEKSETDLGDWDDANVKEMRRIHTHLAALPPNLYVAAVRAINEGRRRHKQALETQDWNEASLYLGQIVDLYRKIGELKQTAFNASSPYEALLLGYGSDLNESQVESLYQGLSDPLTALREQIMSAQDDSSVPDGSAVNVDTGAQGEFVKKILASMGLDFVRGSTMLTTSSPYSGGTREDVRLLMRVSAEGDPLSFIKDALYQGARATYIQNLPEEWKNQPVGQHQGALVMNALSVLFESVIGRMPEFLDYVHAELPALDRQHLSVQRRRVRTSVTRHRADEVSKIVHDLMRYRIEKDLISGALEVKDLPDRWAAESKEALGVEPTNLADGPLQNPDWFTGRFGFIPTNTLSHIIAVSLFDKLESENTGLRDQIKSGDFSTVSTWLTKNIHEKGKSVGAVELVEGLAGKALHQDTILNHFKARYVDKTR